MRRAVRRSLVLAAVGALAAPAAASALADGGRAALPAEARSMTRAIRTTTVAGIGAIPPARYRVTGARVSLRSPFWGVAQLTPTPAARATLEGATVLLVRTGGVSGGDISVGPWVVVDAGTSGVGCRIAPYSVLRDLRMASECTGAGSRL